MLPLERMVRFFDTVDDNWTSPVADVIAARWSGHSGLVRCIRASANYVFHVKGEERDSILRFNHVEERSRTGLQAEVDILQHLIAKGYPVNQPLPSSAGRWVETVETDLGGFHAVMFTQLPGEHIDLEDMSVSRLQRWGRALSELHHAAGDGPLEQRPSLADRLANIRDDLLEADPDYERAYDRAMEQLLVLAQDEDTCGLIHFDFELDNICWDDDQFAVLDFDECCTGPMAADIAYALRDLSEDRQGVVNRDDPRFHTFIAGYRSMRPITDAELDQLPLMMQVHDLLSCIGLRQFLGTDAPDDEPDWAVSLRKRLGEKQALLHDMLTA